MGVVERAESVGSSGMGSRRLGLEAYVYVTLMVVLGSTTAAAARIATREWPVSVFPVFRFLVSGLCLLPFAGIGLGGVRRMFRADWRLLFLAAAFCVPINQAFFLTASRIGPTSHVGIFYATTPLVVLISAWLSRMERVDLSRLSGVLVSVAGIALVGIGSLLGAGMPLEESRATFIADALLIGAVLSWGLYVAASKPLVERHGAIPSLAATFLLGALMCLPFGLATEGAWASLANLSLPSWLTLAFLGVFITPVSQACQNLAMKRMDASQVANFSNLSPLLTVVWGVVFFGETLTPYFMVGGLLTLVGIVWTGWPRAEARSAERVPVAPFREPRLWASPQVDDVALGEAVS